MSWKNSTALCMLPVPYQLLWSLVARSENERWFIYCLPGNYVQSARSWASRCRACSAWEGPGTPFKPGGHGRCPASGQRHWFCHTHLLVCWCFKTAFHLRIRWKDKERFILRFPRNVPRCRSHPMSNPRRMNPWCVEYGDKWEGFGPQFSQSYFHRESVRSRHWGCRWDKYFLCLEFILNDLCHF